jgi:hypothetical protein
MSLIRITVTVPAALVRQADKVARRDDRSRSWVVAEALRRHMAANEATPPAADSTPRPSPAFVAAADRARADHVRAEQRLSPAERLARAEDLGALARAQQGRGSRDQVIAFDTYDDFYRWKAARLIGA